MNPLFPLSFLTLLREGFKASGNARPGTAALTKMDTTFPFPHRNVVGNTRDWPYVAPPTPDMISGFNARSWNLLVLPVI